MWKFKWKLSSNTFPLFLWCCLLCCTRWFYLSSPCMKSCSVTIEMKITFKFRYWLFFNHDFSTQIYMLIKSPTLHFPWMHTLGFPWFPLHLVPSVTVPFPTADEPVRQNKKQGSGIKRRNTSYSRALKNYATRTTIYHNPGPLTLGNFSNHNDNAKENVILKYKFPFAKVLTDLVRD